MKDQAKKGTAQVGDQEFMTAEVVDYGERQATLNVYAHRVTLSGVLEILTII